MKEEYELCIICGSMTGRAGKGDDSIYVDGVGPYCSSCEDLMIYNAKEQVVLAAEDHRDAYVYPDKYESTRQVLNSKVDYYRTLIRRKKEEAKKLSDSGHAVRASAAISSATVYTKFLGKYTKDEAIRVVYDELGIKLRATDTGFEEDV